MRIVIFGPSKSGTTYLFSLLSTVLSEKESLVRAFEPHAIDDQKILVRQDGMSWPDSEHMLVKILFAISDKQMGWTIEQAQDAFAQYDAKIFLVRDPRDRLISQFFYSWYHKHAPDSEAFEHAYQLTLQKEASPESIPFYALHRYLVGNLTQWSAEHRAFLELVGNSIDELHRAGWFVLHYEDLVDQEWGALEDYLGFKLKNTLAASPALSRVSRTNTHSNWRRWFTEEDVVFFKPVFQDFLNTQNYVPDDWDLDKVNSLPAEHGSAYMSRLFHQRDVKVVKSISRRERLQKKLFQTLVRFKQSVLPTKKNGV